MSLSSLEEYLNREFGELPAAGLAERAQRRGQSLLENAPTIRAKAEVDQVPSGIPEWKPPMGVQPEEGDWDRTRLLGSGVVQAAEMGVGAAEYVARQNRFLRPTVAPAIEGIRQGLAGVRESITSGVSEEYLAHVGGELLTLDPDKTIWRGGPVEVADAIYGKFLQSLPSTLLVMLPAARMMRAAQTGGALTYLGASEGTLSLGSIQNNIADEITAMTHEELLKESQRYAQIYESIDDEATARQDFIAETQGLAPVIGGVSVAAISMVTGRLLKPVFEAGTGMGLGRRIGTGFAAEAPQEGSQGAVERVAENAAAQAYDLNRNLSEGVAEAAAQEGLIGGLTGGAVTGAVGQRPVRPPPPLPPPTEDAGGQFGLPGFGPTQKEPGFGIEPEGYRDPQITPEMAATPGVIFAEQQQEIWPDPGTTEGVMVPQQRLEGQGVLPLGLAGTVPLAERGPGQRTLTEVDEVIPDELDQPTAEPVEDLQAQIEDMRKSSGRSAVYVSPDQGPTDQLKLPKGAVIIPDFDGKGGRLIAKNQQAAQYARERRAEGGSMQAIIGELTLAGTGKPNVKAGYAVQLLGDNGAVARESLKATKREANALAKEWKADGEVRVLSGPEALARRSDILEKEQIELRTEEPAAIAEATKEMFPAEPQPLTAGDIRTEVKGIAVRLFDQSNNLIDEQVFGTQKEADVLANEWRDDLELSDARIIVQPVREKATPEKAGLATTKQVPVHKPRGPKKTIREKVVEEIRTKLSFEERAEVADIIQDPTSTDLAVDRLVKAGRMDLAEKIDAVKARSYRREEPTPIVEPFDADMSNEEIEALTGAELESVFQSAVQSRADTSQGVEVPVADIDVIPVTEEAGMPSKKELVSEWRTKNRARSQKVQFIRRQRASVLRRLAEVKNVRGTPVTTKLGAKATKTEALTYETVSGEETVTQELERKAAVKEANTRLRFALNRAKRFLGRFDTTGVYGVYVAENTNVSGTLTKEAKKFQRAHNALSELVKLANSVLASGNTSNAHATLAKKTAIGLERIKLKSMTPQSFAQEFGAIAKATEQRFFRGAKIKETAAVRESKVAKLNRNRANAAKRVSMLEGEWKNDIVWNEIVAPIIRKFSEESLANAADPAKNTYYNPTMDEIEALRYALRTFRKMTARYPTVKFYKPLKEQLQYYGFEFDAAGDLIVQEFHPSDNLLGPGFKAQYGISKAAAMEVTGRIQTPGGQVIEPRVRVPDTTKIRSDEEVTENRTAVRNIRIANALIQKFKDMVAPSKTTINGIKRQEQRLVRGLRKIDAWRDISPGMGRISLGGWKSKTYRLVGPRLDAKTMHKAEAKHFVSRMAKITMPRELTTVARAMDTEQGAANIESFVDENTLEFFIDSARPVEYDENYMEAATNIGDMILGGPADAMNVITEILKAAPIDSFYYALADKISTMNLTDVVVEYGQASDFPRGQFAKFRPSTNQILMNRETLREMSAKGDRVFGARIMHSLTHESLHATTHQNIKANPHLRQYYESLQHMAREQLGETKFYGLRRGKPIDEFVVEAFSDPEFQQALRTVKVDTSTVWQKIMAHLKEMLGIAPDIPDSVLDAIMLTEDILFESTGISGTRDSADFFMESFDQPLREIALPFLNKFVSTSKILQNVRERGKNAVLAITSMEQFVERYTGRLIKEGRDLMQEYDKAFRQRNAKAALHLEVPQQLSGRWTELESTNPEDAVAVSQIGTEASLLTIDPRIAVTDEANEHLGTELHDDHARLHAQYTALSKEGKAVFNDALSYYSDALETETMFLMQSALRGMLASGDTPTLTTEEFEKRFSISELKKLQTRDDLSDALSEFFEESGRRDILDTLYKMSMVPRKRQGIYMPMMRYGDDVSFAEKVKPDVIYEDRKGAMAERATLLSDDPTLDVGVFPTEDGKFALRITERVFIMGESISEVETIRDEMVADPTNDLIAEDFFDTQKRLDKKIDEAITSNASLRSILDALSGNNAAQAAIKNFYLRNLSEQSFRKHEIKRKNRKGVRYDLQHRNLATYAKQASYYTAQLEFGWRMAKALSEMYDVATRTKSEAGTEGGNLTRVVKHLQSRDALSADLPTRPKWITKSIEATHFFMLASPSYWAINASQPWMVTLPTLGARHGWAASASSMKQFQRVIFGDLAREAAEMKGGLTALKGGSAARVEQTFNIIRQIEKRLIAEYDTVDSKGYVDLLENLRANHIIDINVFTEMRDVAVGKKKNAWDRTIDASRIMAHLTEVNNRVVTALAAYQLELNETGSVEAATEYAGKMVSQTQFNYSAENKPPVFQKAPILFQFMQWPQHMYAHLIRNYQGMVQAGVMDKSEARSALLGLIGTHAAVGGMTGMMLQPIKWAFGLTLMAFGDEDEPYTFKNAVSGRSYDHMITKLAADAFGTTAATFIGKGIPAGLGVDLSIRMSMGTVYFVDLRGDNAQSVLGSLVASFGGASLNQGLKFATGAGKIMDGQVYRGIETMLPKIARDAMRAGRYYNEGLVNNAGDTVIPANEMSVGEVMAQFFGFAPTDVSQAYEAQTAIKDAERYNIDRRSILLRRFRDADTSTVRREVTRDIQTFNRSNPGERITTSALLQNRRAQRVREARFKRYGANIDERKARFYEKYADPYRDLPR